ncbi:MAG TPA: type II toxin-antitoxin system VapC family toxin [Gemmataceae bacterium]
MKIYLLDSNVCIAYMRQSDPGLVQKVQNTAPKDIRLCSVVLGELYYGTFHGLTVHQASSLAQIAQLRQAYSSIPFDDASAERYGRICADLAAKGELIGPNDLLIAAIALAHGLTLVTHNSKEFSRVPGLTLEDWQTPTP